ncbi:hypothetical protein OOT00_05945 [Desulfobotulus sp. H1]|uniref:Chromosome segregation ATPase n=1 Tax=Desulfobotulus pelophilus TaxID=2823377 RepID=A0ABT3N7U5_9BACT|nr:hypothetical protein [Desulfobotulus pelophilus]MCW7753529.1 hypothetical protein [Desulfobotulus pelophilus]
MFRLNKFFVSDIKAGDNILRNGFVPVFREDGDADHGVLFAANGTCKTTLLSFILSVFSPSRQRFVQHLQSGGDKSLDQYLIPGRPAIVMLDLAMVLQPTLFETKPVDHLVLGQLLYRHSNTPDKVDRTFFLARSADFFDTLRSQWDGLLDQEKPYQALKDFMAPLIQQTSSQKEWEETLEELGLDPWLIDRQVDFARTEGGIKDAFRFKSEGDFLSFFLGCVTDMEAAKELRERMDQDLSKMKDRPRKRAQLDAVRSLKERIADFDTIAALWRSAGKAIEKWRMQLGEASHLLHGAEASSRTELEELENEQKHAEDSLRTLRTGLETTRSNILYLEHFCISSAVEEGEKSLHRNHGESEALKAEKNALLAADFMADIRKNQAEADTKDKALAEAGKEINPLQEKLKTLAAQYHLRLDADRHGLKAAMENLCREEEERKQHQRAVEKKQQAGEILRQALEKELENLNGRIRGAEAGRTLLPLDPGEEPSAALDRLHGEKAGFENRIIMVEKEMSAGEEALKAQDRNWRRLLEECSKAQGKRSESLKAMEEEADLRRHLLEDPHLVRIAGTRDMEISSAELLSRLDDTLVRSEERLRKKERQTLQLEEKLEALDQGGGLAADDLTRRLLSYYHKKGHEKGIAPGELKSYPEYLADLYPAPEILARYIEGDPARFTGMMAASQDVIESILEMPPPPWLHRPVVISTPCAPEAVSTVEQTLIRPLTPEVYSRQHMEKVREEYQKTLEKVAEEREEARSLLKAMEGVSRNLHAYQERFPDAGAVAALRERADAGEKKLSEIKAAIAEAEAGMEALSRSKTDLESRYRHLKDQLADLSRMLQQVNTWVSSFADLAAWEEEREKKTLEKGAVEKAIRADGKTLTELKEKELRIFKDIHICKSDLKGLDEKASEIMRPEDTELKTEEQEEALSMDLQTLLHLHRAARETLRQMSHTLGIDHLGRELEDLQARIARLQSEFEAFGRSHSFDGKSAENWATRGFRDRKAYLESLSGKLEGLKESRIRMETELEHKKKDQIRSEALLSEQKAKGFPQDLREENLKDQDTDALLHRLESEKRRQQTDCETLFSRSERLKEKLSFLEKWRQELRIAMAENQTFEPLWDQDSPRHPWPDLLEPGRDRMASIRQLLEEIREMAAAERKERETGENARRRMRSAFDRLQTHLQDDACRHDLPAVVDALRSHDAESLGLQAEDLIRRCEDIARNIEMDLKITQRFMDSLVDRLLQHSRDYHQKLQSAARELLPETVFIYGGKPILRTGVRLDFARYQDAFRQSVENWLYQLMQQNRLPEVNPKAGNGLGSELLYQLLGAASGRENFGIRMLKCDDSGSTYEPVGKDLGSGGEALTIAVMLYTLLISMRKKRNSASEGRIPAFLILDNPLGVCNRSDFVDAQLKVAGNMGLQCVYFTGIHDRESLELFELRTAIRKGDKKLEIDGISYNCLEVTELNVEKTKRQVNHHQAP